MGKNLTTFFFSELCWGKAMVAYTMPQQRQKEESERLRGERDLGASLVAAVELFSVLNH